MEDRIQAVVKHAGRLLCLRELLTQRFIFIKDRCQYNQVHSILQNLSQDASSVNVRVAQVSFLLSSMPIEIDLRKVLYILNRFFQVCHLFNVNREKSVEWNLPVDVCLSLHEAACVGLRTAQTFFYSFLLSFPCPCFLFCEVLRQSLIVDLNR